MESRRVLEVGFLDGMNVLNVQSIQITSESGLQFVVFLILRVDTPLDVLDDDLM